MDRLALPRRSSIGSRRGRCLAVSTTQGRCAPGCRTSHSPDQLTTIRSGAPTECTSSCPETERSIHRYRFGLCTARNQGERLLHVRADCDPHAHRPGGQPHGPPRAGFRGSTLARGVSGLRCTLHPLGGRVSGAGNAATATKSLSATDSSKPYEPSNLVKMTGVIGQNHLSDSFESLLGKDIGPKWAILGPNRDRLPDVPPIVCAGQRA